MESETTIDLRKLLALFKKHIFSMVFLTFGCGVIGWFVAKTMVTPKYATGAQLLVSQKANKDDLNAALQAQQAGVQAIDTYKDIIKNDVIMSAVQKKLANPTRLVRAAQPAKFRTLADGTKRLIRKAKAPIYERAGMAYNVSRGQLDQSISVSSNANSQVFAVNVVDSNPDRAAAIANATAEVFKAKIGAIMAISNVSIIARATTPSAPSSPKMRYYVVAGLLLGLFISVVIILVRDMFDVTVRDEAFLVQDLGLTNLGIVSRIKLSAHDRKLTMPSTKRASRRV